MSILLKISTVSSLHSTRKKYTFYYYNYFLKLKVSYFIDFFKKKFKRKQIYFNYFKLVFPLNNKTVKNQ